MANNPTPRFYSTYVPKALSKDSVPIETMEQYIKALQTKDWSYDFSDDSSAWARGRREHEWIMAAAKKLDPQLEIYNQHAPDYCRGGFTRG